MSHSMYDIAFEKQKWFDNVTFDISNWSSTRRHCVTIAESRDISRDTSHANAILSFSGDQHHKNKNYDLEKITMEIILMKLCKPKIIDILFSHNNSSFWEKIGFNQDRKKFYLQKLNIF